MKRNVIIIIIMDNLPTDTNILIRFLQTNDDLIERVPTILITL